jgi:hypothetical protein
MIWSVRSWLTSCIAVQLMAPDAGDGTGHELGTSEPGRSRHKRDLNPSNFSGLNFLRVYMDLQAMHQNGAVIRSGEYRP